VIKGRRLLSCHSSLINHTHQSPITNSALRTVFFNNIATVIGPTPPGTGVMNDARFATASKSTSPTVRRLPSGCFTRLIPTSITTAPSRTWSAVISAACRRRPPAPRHAACAAPSRAWRYGNSVTVARRLREQQRDRLAGDLAGAHDHRLGPPQADAGRFDQLQHRQGRARRDQRVAIDDMPDVRRVHALDVFDGMNLVLQRGGVQVGRQRQVQHDAVTAASLLSE